MGAARHREAWAEESVSPTKSQFMSAGGSSSSGAAANVSGNNEPARAPVRKIVEPIQTTSTASTSFTGPSSSTSLPKDLDTLIVVSKVKQLVRDQSEFNMSQCCIDALTQKVAEAAIKGIENARNAGRKTVMGRDIR